MAVTIGLLSFALGMQGTLRSWSWHSSGRDRGRYPGRCWLFTLGVLHPGVPVMWCGLIRDLTSRTCSPQLKAVRGAVCPM